MPGVSGAALAKAAKKRPEKQLVNTTPELIDSIKAKNARKEKLSLEEMIIWNAAKLKDGWGYCTKHRKKYQFSKGCQACNDTCNYCGIVIPDNEAARHHETCTKIPKNIKKQISKRILRNIELGKKLDELKALPDTPQNRNRISSVRRQMMRDV